MGSIWRRIQPSVSFGLRSGVLGTADLICGSVRRFRGVASSVIYRTFTASSQKSLLFEPRQGTCLIEALFAHHERQYSPTLFGLEVAPGAGVKLEPE